MEEKISVFEYLDYRKFLLDCIDNLRRRAAYSDRKFAAQCGIKSSSHVRLILQGKRCLTKPTLRKLAKGLHLDRMEILFLEALAGWNDSKSPEEKADFEKEIQEFKALRHS